ncbi:SpoIIE family protein phosphatase [Azospirillum sp. ST 5-10]|uniref:SpoIIE family protein phosphatase n=1 Tax=unclassified Azospirillum TaxID=2630922 RepID=UPI003F4A609E
MSAVLNSLKAKVFLLVIVLLGIVAATVMTLSKRDVERAMLDSEVEAAQNVVQLVKRDITNRYRALLMEKVRTITAGKEHLRQTSGVVQAALGQFAALADQGLIGEDEARAAALDWMSDLRLDEAGRQYVFAFDRNNRAVAYPNPAMIGQDLGGFTDYKGRSLVETVRGETDRYRETFSTYRWKEAGEDQAVAKFGHFFRFPRWNWIVGTVNDIRDVENDVRRKIDAFVDELRVSMPAIHVARTGYVFVFDGKGNIVVPPRDNPDVAGERNPLTGNRLLDDLKAAATEAGATSVFHVAGNGEPMESHASYFKALDWYVVATTSTEEIGRPARLLIARQGIIFAVVLLVSAGLGYLYAARLSRPLVTLTRYANDLSAQDFSKPSATAPGQAIADLPRRHRDEVGRLANAFIYMETSLRDNVRLLMDATAARQRIESELTIARDIQIGLLPKIFPEPPESHGFELYSTLHSAKEVGGDLYDFYFLDPHHLCLTVGDVSGKGVPAALFMAVTKTLIKVVADRVREPAQILAQVNDELSLDNPNMMFVTLVVGILDVRTGMLRYASAGHNPPLLLTRDGRAEYLKEAAVGMACGIMEGVAYGTATVTLARGDTLLLYTDGVTEAMDPADRLYSDEKLLDLARHRLAGHSARAIVDAVVTSVGEHANGAEQSDDITVLALRYYGMPADDGAAVAAPQPAPAFKEE